MSLTNYTDLTAGIQNWLQRQDLNSVIPDFITLFEACANRRLRVRQMEANTILTPDLITPVLGATANGRGNIRLTLASIAPPFTGDEVTVAGIAGTTEANGSWTVNVVNSTQLDLVDSLFVNAYVSGGTVTDIGNVALPSDYLAWRRVTWLGSPQRDLDYVHPSVIVYEYPEVPASPPSKFTIEGGVLRVMPQDPTSLGVTYYQKIPPLAANSTNWLMTSHPDLYLFGSLAEAQGYAVDPDKLALWKSRRDELFDELIRLDSKTRSGAAVMVKAPTP